jgi:hypothetical protein
VPRTLILLGLLLASPLAAQQRTVGATARFSYAVAGAGDGVGGLGVEAELLATGRVVPVVRLDEWYRPTDCLALGGCASSNVTTLAAGLRYRARSESRTRPYAGVDLGRTWWDRGERGWMWRARGGLDLRLLPFLDLNIEVGLLRFGDLGSAEPPLDGLVAGSVGMRVRV